MSDPAAQTMKEESTASTNQILNDRDDSSESDSHKEFPGEYDEPSAEPADVKLCLIPKEDGEMIEKTNENAQNEDEEKKEIQDMERLGQEHQPVEGECLKEDPLNIQQSLNKSLQDEEKPQKMGPLKAGHEPMEMGPLGGVQPPKAKPETMEEEQVNGVQLPKTEHESMEREPLKIEHESMEMGPLDGEQSPKAEYGSIEQEPLKIEHESMEMGSLDGVQPPQAEHESIEQEPLKIEYEPMEMGPLDGEQPLKAEHESMEREPLKVEHELQQKSDPPPVTVDPPPVTVDPPPVTVDPPPVTVDHPRGRILAALVVLVLGILLKVLVASSGGTQIPESRSVLQVFQNEFKILEDTFPKQTRDLWLRSEKMLQNHLKKSHPREPATIILTAAQDAKDTLLCLGAGLAKAYSVALEAKWLMIDGPSEAKYDSGTAKLHIDELLSSGFESTARAAVLSRLETLPSGSLLILYKYCDHENAAYKNVTLVLTVLLDEPSLERETPLPDLEEKVRDFLYERLITSDGIRSHNEMDRDKLGGVWSRISHLVLPVLPVSSIETGSCPLDYTGR